MNESQGSDRSRTTSESRRTGSGRRRIGGASSESETGAQSAPSPCGACKFLRRKCLSECIFAPYFSSDQGAARFAAVHKIFGASNVSKLLSQIPENRRQDAVVTISYEAQSRLSDPVYGCVSTVLALQQQVAALQAELVMVQAQLMNRRYIIANALQSPPPPEVQDPPQQNYHIVPMQQPAYSNASDVTNNNLLNLNTLASNRFDFPGENGFAPFRLPPATTPLPEGDDEQESRPPASFTTHIFN